MIFQKSLQSNFLENLFLSILVGNLHTLTRITMIPKWTYLHGTLLASVLVTCKDHLSKGTAADVLDELEVPGEVCEAILLRGLLTIVSLSFHFYKI